MNNGTKIRTALAIIVAINQAVATVAPPDFGNEAANTIYKLISYFLNLAALAICTYYNNDFTEEGQLGTYITRALKDDPSVTVSLEDIDEDPDELDGDFDEVIEEAEENEVE